MKNTNVSSEYNWSGVNNSGKDASGIISARSLAIAKAQLCTQGIIIKKISKQRRPFFDRKNKKINQADITVFSRQMATMIQAGIPIRPVMKQVNASIDQGPIPSSFCVCFSFVISFPFGSCLISYWTFTDKRKK